MSVPVGTGSAREPRDDPNEYLFTGMIQALEELLPDLVRGDPEAEATLRMELRKTLACIRRRLLDPSMDARDCLQDAWCKLLERLRASWSPARFADVIGFLASRALWRAWDVNKRLARRPRHVSLSDVDNMLVADDPAPDQRLEMLREALAALPDDARQLLVWTYLDRLPRREICEKTGLNPHQLAYRLQLARQAVRRQFAE